MRPYSRCLLAAAALCAAPAALAAQLGGGVDGTPPTIAVAPGTSAVTADSVRVTVSWSDNASLDPASRSITLNGVEVKTSFTYSGSATAATSIGTVHLVSGSNVVRAQIADVEGNVGTAVQVTYTWSPPAPPPPPPPADPVYTVAVSPKGGDSLKVSAGASVTAPFTVANTGNTTTTFVATGACGSGIASSCAGATRDTFALAAGESRQVGVLFTASSTVGAAGRMSLTVRRVGDATVADSGWVGVRLVAPGSLNAAAQARPYLDRGDCIVASLGGGAASECGDLRLAHALPGTRTLNQPRAPVLLYNSRHAYPQTIHTAQITNGTGAPWDSVSAVVRRGGVVMASGRWPGWTDTAVHGIALSFPDLAQPSTAPGAALYSDTLVVSVKSGGAWGPLASFAANHVVVDRRGSPFGAGWWMAGLERIHFIAGDQILWVGGDGSTRVYSPVSLGHWVSAEPDAPDTIAFESVTAYNGSVPGGYVRLLPGKGRVAFGPTGLHMYTRNRLGQTTWFFYDGSNRLTQVALPTAVPGDTTYSYWFNYNSAAGTLGEVVAPHVATPGDRRTVLVASGAAGAVRVSQITDYPGTTESSTRQFSYDAFGRASQVLAPGTLTPTRFVYHAAGRVYQGLTIAVNNGHTDTVAVGVVPLEVRGLPNAAGSALAWTDLFTSVNGPLPGNGDAVLYYHDAAGRVAKVTTPRGALQVYRTDPRYPALATATVAPNGYRVTASYDARGRLASQTQWNPLGDGRNATTLYSWNDAWDEVAGVTTPTGITTTFGYDARGLREWEQVGPDSARRVRYGYNAQGQVRTVTTVSATQRGEGAETVAYDSLATGNLLSTITPLGIRTVTHLDRIGRPRMVITPADSLRSSNGAGAAAQFSYDSTTYDLASRVRETSSWGQAQYFYSKMDSEWHLTSETVLRVRNSYDNAGRLWKVERWSEPDAAGVGTVTTSFEFDAFGRKTAEVAGDGKREVYHYDLAGRDTLVINRRVERIRMTYDAYGDLLTRTMQGDSSVFRYHPVTGLLTGADNASAHVGRSYYPNGALENDTLHIANEAGQFVNRKHQFALVYSYDLEGRRSGLTLPDSLRPSPTQNRFTYQYDPVTGAPARIIEPGGAQFSFAYRADGALDTLSLPGVSEVYHYDADGRMTRRIRAITGAGTPLYDDSLRYDPRGKTIFARTMRDSTALTYDGLGHLAHSRTHDWTSRGANLSEEEYTADALGNTVTQRRNSWSLAGGDGPVLIDPTVYSYQNNGTGRHVSSLYAPATSNYLPYRRHDDAINFWDDAGNLTMRIDTVSLNLGFGTASNPPTFLVDSAAPPVRSATADGDGSSSGTGVHGTVATYTYRPDGKLLQVVRDAGCVLWSNNDGTATCIPQHVPEYLKQDRTETYRYDALGRRVYVHTTTPVGGLGNGRCAWRCDNTIRRTVWDGGQVLAEIRYPDGAPDQDTGLDPENAAALASTVNATTPGNHPYGGANTSVWAQSGRVLYVHGGGIDQPLGLIRMDYSHDFQGATLLVPHANWRGVYEMATFGWDRVNCVQRWMPASEVVQFDSMGHLAYPLQGETQDVQQQRCMLVDFPGKYMGMTHLSRRQTVAGPVSWMGSLVQDAQDASGLMYRRNRQYDPATGRFTQEDPIGLAGGLNTYGFAAGDPVSFGDPYGLCPPPESCLAMAAGATIADGPLPVGDVVAVGLLAAAAYFALTNADDIAIPRVGDGTRGRRRQAGPFVYRALEPLQDHPQLGLFARNPAAGNSPLSHVAGKKDSQWISTTKSVSVALGKYGGAKTGVVRIDLSKVTTPVVDLSGGIPNGGRFSNYARADQEVLIQGYVPPQAIERIR